MGGGWVALSWTNGRKLDGSLGTGGPRMDGYGWRRRGVPGAVRGRVVAMRRWVTAGAVSTERGISMRRLEWETRDRLQARVERGDEKRMAAMDVRRWSGIRNTMEGRTMLRTLFRLAAQERESRAETEESLTEVSRRRGRDPVAQSGGGAEAKCHGAPWPSTQIPSTLDTEPPSSCHEVASASRRRGSRSRCSRSRRSHSEGSSRMRSGRRLPQRCVESSIVPSAITNHHIAMTLRRTTTVSLLQSHSLPPLHSYPPSSPVQAMAALRCFLPLYPRILLSLDSKPFHRGDSPPLAGSLLRGAADGEAGRDPSAPLSAASHGPCLSRPSPRRPCHVPRLLAHGRGAHQGCSGRGVAKVRGKETMHDAKQSRAKQ